MEFFRIKNFEKYNGSAGVGSRQWIKLYKKIMHDWEYTQLHDSYKAAFLHLLLVADAVDNRFPCDSVAIKRQLNLNTNVKIEVFEKAGLIVKISEKNPIRQDETRRDKTRQGSKKTKSKKRVVTSLNRYHDLFLYKFKTKPLIEAKHGAMMARLEKKMGRDEIMDLIERYFKTDEEFIIKAGFTIEVFISQINKLIVSRTAKSGSNGTGKIMGINGDEFDPKTETDPALLEGDKYE